MVGNLEIVLLNDQDELIEEHCIKEVISVGNKQYAVTEDWDAQMSFLRLIQTHHGTELTDIQSQEEFQKVATFYQSSL